MRTLVIPDIHNQTMLADQIIDKEPVDQIVLLGDLYDSYNDTIYMAESTARWEQELTKNPKVKIIWGNHDCYYGFRFNPLFRSGGYSELKDRVINEIMTPEDWSNRKWYVFVDGWLLTHGGLHRYLMPESSVSVKDYLDAENAMAWRQAPKYKGKHWFFQQGISRFGNYPFGGLTWCDFIREFIPITNLNQIVGHTPQTPLPRWYGEDAINTFEPHIGGNLGLDSHLYYYAIIEDGVATVKRAN